MDLKVPGSRRGTLLMPNKHLLNEKNKWLRGTQSLAYLKAAWKLGSLQVPIGRWQRVQMGLRCGAETAAFKDHPAPSVKS